MEIHKSKKGHKRDIKPFKFAHGEVVLVRGLFPPLAKTRWRVVMRHHQRVGFNIYHVRNLETGVVYDCEERLIVRPVVQEILRERANDLSPSLSSA